MHRFIVSTDDDKKRVEVTGPYQLQQMRSRGEFLDKHWCFDLRTKEWLRVADMIAKCRPSTTYEILEEVDQTITDLGTLAQEIQELLKNG